MKLRYKDKMEMEILGCGIRDRITAITGTLLCALYSILGSMRIIQELNRGFFLFVVYSNQNTDCACCIQSRDLVAYLPQPIAATLSSWL